MSRLAIWLTAGAVGWVVLVVAAPLALTHGAVWLPVVAYHAGSLLCHQRPERSFHLAGTQLPVCARCFGLYASGAAGALMACVYGPRTRGLPLGRSAALLLGVCAIPSAVSLAAEWAGLAQTTGLTRAIAAVPLGIAAGWLLVRQCDAITRPQARVGDALSSLK